MRCSDILIKVGQVQGLTWLFSSSRQKSIEYKQLIIDTFQQQEFLPSSCHCFCFLSLFVFSHPKKKTFTLHWSEKESLAEGLCENHPEFSQTSCRRWELAKLGINKQPGYFRVVERVTWMCPLLSHWGIDKHFFFPECTLEQMPAPLKPLQKQWLTSVESGYHLPDMVVREQSLAKALTTPLITRLIYGSIYMHTLTYICIHESKGKTENVSWLLNNSVSCTFKYQIKFFCSAFRFQAEKENTYFFSF